ncbi:hypothetical protein [Tabrizicola sp. BL-A-41-H6]|uniref:hypothetical protein n=1 Tax=Tabrizicola sp. BL-A-41-H6 TaxID=3421107 RepID=UPI003D66E992
MTKQEKIDAPEAQNLRLWNALKPVDKKFTKKITGKSYQGDSPNPTYVIQKLTEQLGPIGIRWGFTVAKETTRYGKPHKILVEDTVQFDSTGEKILGGTKRYEVIREEMHQVEIDFWILDDLDVRRSFTSFGGTPMLYMSKSGNWVHDEDAAKKSLTDAYTKAASWLGSCAEIFLGIFDGKNTGTMPEPDAEDPAGDEKPETPQAKRQTTTPAGW